MSPRRNRSVVILVLAVALGIAGYFGWYAHRPNDVHASEEVVRRFSAAIAKEISPLRRRVRQLTKAPLMDDDASAKVRAELEQLAQQALARIDQLAEDASTEIEQMSGISLKTQDNRLNRIDQRQGEAKTAVESAIAAAKTTLGLGSDHAPAATPRSTSRR